MRDNGSGGNFVGFAAYVTELAGLNITTAGTDADEFVDPDANDWRLKAGAPGAGLAGAGTYTDDVTVADFTTEARAVMRGAPGTGGGTGVTVANFTGQALRDVRAR